MRLEPLADKWRAFGWRVLEIDGHDMGAIVEGLEEASAVEGQPDGHNRQDGEGERGSASWRTTLPFTGRLPARTSTRWRWRSFLSFYGLLRTSFI